MVRTQIPEWLGIALIRSDWKRFGSCVLKDGQKSIRLNPFHSYSIRGTIRTNSNQFERSFRSMLGLIETEFPIRLYPISGFGFIRIDASYWSGMNGVELD